MWLLLTTLALAGVPPRILIADSDQADAEAQVPVQEAWQEARLQAAQAGHPEPVSLPVTYRSAGWGCLCPEIYVGTSVGMFTTGPWLKLTYAPGLAPPQPTREGLVVVAEGHFKGTTTLDLQPPGEEIPEWVYTLQDFHVTAWRPWRSGGEDDWMSVLTAAPAPPLAPVPAGPPP